MFRITECIFVRGNSCSFLHPSPRGVVGLAGFVAAPNIEWLQGSPLIPFRLHSLLRNGLPAASRRVGARDRAGVHCPPPPLSLEEAIGFIFHESERQINTKKPIGNHPEIFLPGFDRLRRFVDFTQQKRDT